MNKKDVTNESKEPAYILGRCLFMEGQVNLDIPLQH